MKSSDLLGLLEVEVQRSKFVSSTGLIREEIDSLAFADIKLSKLFYYSSKNRHVSMHILQQYSMRIGNSKRITMLNFRRLNTPSCNYCICSKESVLLKMLRSLRKFTVSITKNKNNLYRYVKRRNERSTLYFGSFIP